MPNPPNNIMPHIIPPHTLLVDREGRELWRKTGAATWDSGDFVEHLRRQMRGSAS